MDEMSMTQLVLDERDKAILAERVAALDARPGPRVGDFVEFADGVVRRISYEWTDGQGWHGGYQTSDGGSYYLAKGYCNFSGSLYHTTPADTLTPTEETRPGAVWFFHHDWRQAHNDVNVEIPFRVYLCSLEAPR